MRRFKTFYLTSNLKEERMAVHTVSHVSAPPVHHNPPPKPQANTGSKPAQTTHVNNNSGSSGNTGKTVNKTA
jgi:hypothetical protein